MDLASPPYIHCQNTAAKMMRHVLYALLPGTLIAFFYLGFGLLIQLFIAILCALLCEAVMLGIRRQPIWPGLAGGSALVTAWLFALVISPFTSWWVNCAGIAFAIIIVKHCYGGLGYNLFNPAIAGYIFIVLAFPGQSALWPTLTTIGDLDLLKTAAVIFADQQIGMEVGGNLISSTKRTMQPILLQPWAISPGSIVGWAWIEVGFLCGGIWLLYTRVISWRIPCMMIITLLSIAAFFYVVDSATYLSPLVYLFSGGTLLSAFFIATDPVSAAITPRGRLIYAAGIGLFTYVIRTWTPFVDGVAFAILSMNCVAPLIDQYARPRILRK